MFRTAMICVLLTLLANTRADAQARPTTPHAAILFTDVTAAAGLVDPLAGMMGHGGAWGDYDGDGRADIYVGGFCDRPDSAYKPAAGPVANRLFRNLGDGRFEQVAAPQLQIHARTSGALFADLDNDGDLELYVSNNVRAPPRLPLAEPVPPVANQPADDTIQSKAKYIHSRLYRNDGGKFVDVSAYSGACPTSLRTARNVGLLDYDGDGLLDLLIVEDRFTAKPRSVLLKNLGGMKFQDVTRQAGLPDDLFGLGLAIADINDDGRPDIFVGHSNRFFLSGSDNKYREPASLAKTFAWQPLDNEDWPCGAAFGDLNRDGRLDLVVAIHGVRARNRVYLNEGLRDGVPQFRDVSAEVGFPAEVPNKCPHVEIQDFDNDGWPDIYFSAAWLDDDGKVTPLVFRNVGINAESGLPRFVPPRDIAAPMVYYSAGPSADFDRDGRVDLLLVNWFAGNHTRLLRNESGGETHSRNAWLQVQVVGRAVNRMGVGVKVRVYRAGQLGKPEALLGYQEIAAGYGYASGQEAIAHFGLAREKSVDVEVTLPGGKTIRRTSIDPRQRIIINEDG